MKKIVHLFFLVPFIVNALNLQDWISLYVGGTSGQLVAYGNVGLLILGSFLIIKLKGSPLGTPGTWAVFFAVHYSLSILASILYNNPANFGYTLVNIVFYFSFLLYLKRLVDLSFIQTYFTIVFSIASICLIFLWNMQLDLDYFSSDISWGLDRASGLYGDANNACLVSIISYVFLKFTDFGNLPFKSLIKLILTLLISYSVILTFSTTGYLVFVFVVILCNYKYLSKRNILASMFALPLLYLIIINLTWLTAGLNLNERQQSKIVNFENIFSFKFDQIDNSGRFEHIDNVIGKLYENPFFGHGFDFGLNHLTHNTYLNIWLESGIIGLLVLIVVLAIYFSRAIKVEKKTKYFSLAILFAVSIFMLSLQTVINQPYIMVVLTYVGVLIDKGLIKKNDERFS
ncbi:O-antigen ligase family protein [Muricauda sp. SYSU M84420]|uniref:O-antigen ligase family protein n=2 Tax=Flagellimonas halotolerans TaxID=3112164 RepID=A0ABU6ISC2_9FLAO|nr:O-antigen ligase family protein [Muricauda sp. SYSU M84420]